MQRDEGRSRRRHVVFGADIHRYLGSNLARMGTNVAIEARLRMIHGLEDPDAQVGGRSGAWPRDLPIAFPARPAI